MGAHHSSLVSLAQAGSCSAHLPPRFGQVACMSKRGEIMMSVGYERICIRLHTAEPPSTPDTNTARLSNSRGNEDITNESSEPAGVCAHS